MAITYHAGRRIQGLSTDVANTTTFNELFDSTGHTTDGTTVNGWYATDISALKYDGDNDNMYFNNAMDNTDDIMYYDLQNSNALGSGNFANATKWVVRMKINIGTSSGSGANGNQFSIGLSSAVGITDTYDFMGIHIVQNHSSAGDIVCNATVNNGYPQNQGTSGNRLGATSIDMASNSDWWLEIKRDGDDCTCTLYEDEFTGTSYTKTNTVTDISNLRYIFFRPQKDSGGATFTGSIDNIEVYDGVSLVTNKPTNVQLGSRFEETDTRKMYNLQGASTTTYETDFSTDPTISSNDIGNNYYDSTNDRWYIRWDWDNTNDAGSIDLYSKIGNQNLSDSDWVVRFKYTIVSQNFTIGTDSKQFFVGLTSTDYSNAFWYPDNSNVSTNFGLYMNKSGTYQLYTNNNSTYSGGTWTNTSRSISNETLYVELIRENSTTAKMNLYSDSSYSTLLVGVSLTIASGLTGLRYLSVKGMRYSSSGTITSNMDDLEIYNDISSVLASNTWQEIGA